MGAVRATASEGKKSAAIRPAESCLCIVMVCTDMSEANQVGRQLSEVNSGCLVTYRRVQDLTHNAPAGKVALIILATQDQPGRARPDVEVAAASLASLPDHRCG